MEPLSGLIRSSVQWTPEQYRWLQQRAERLGLRSVSAVARMVVQEAMNAEYRARGADMDTEQ
jgi:hypothetical protein